MDPTPVFCDHPTCPARGLIGQGNIKVHSQKERRYRCHTCGKTFAASKGTPFYRLHKESSLFVCVLTLLSHGCPVPAIVAAFGLDERTIADWDAKAGSHSQLLQQHFLEHHPLDLQHVQADELYAKRQGGRSWMAMAMAVPTRLWLGGVVSPVRNLKLIQRLVDLVRLAWIPGTALLICVDGLASYPTAFWRTFRDKVYTGRRGRPSYRLPEGISLGQVIKKHSGRRLVEVVRRVRWGSAAEIIPQLRNTKTGQQINTSYIERRRRHLPGRPGGVNASGAEAGTAGRGSRQRYVPDRGGIQFLLATQSARAAGAGAQVATANARDGRWLDQPHLVYPRTP
jgi:transposase-like protein